MNKTHDYEPEPPLHQLPHFPMTGWQLIEVIDLMQTEGSCEFCRKKDEEIRYQHILENERWLRNIKVGCVCSGKLIGNLEYAREQEQAARRISANRNRWINLALWKPTPKVFTRMDKKTGLRATAFLSSYGDKWSLCVDGAFCKESFATSTDAITYSWRVLNTATHTATAQI